VTVQVLDGRDLAASLAAAQDALSGAPPGTQLTWLLPEGEHDVPAGLEVGTEDVALTVRGGGPVRLAGGQWTVKGSTVVVEAVEVAGGSLRLLASGRALARNVRVHDVHDDAVTALSVRGDQVEVFDCSVSRAGASAGRAVGIEAVAVSRVEVTDVAVRDLSGSEVTAVAAHGPTGEMRGVTVTGLTATAEEPVAVVVDLAIEVSGVHVERRVDAAELASSLQAAQARLEEAPPGTTETWRLPPGRFELSEPLKLGAMGQSLRLVGVRQAGEVTELVLGGGAPAAGDVVALELLGARVIVDELAVRARATGELVGVSVTAAEVAEVSDLQVRELRGASAVGVRVTAPVVSLVDVSASDLRGSTGNVAGVVVSGGGLSVSRVTIDRIKAAAEGTGVTATARTALAAAMIRVEDVRGAAVTGIRLRTTHGGGELSVLDARVRVVVGSGEATGAAVVSGGDVALRGVSASEVAGEHGTGVVVVAAAEVDWAGGAILDVRGTTGGAAGARIVAAPSQSEILVQDLQVEAVRAATVGATAEPPGSWRDWLEAGRGPLAVGGALPPLPAAEDTAGIHVSAVVDEFEPWIDEDEPGLVQIDQCVLRRISGTALQVDGGLRDVQVRGVEAWTAVRGGWLGGERVLLAQSTWHRHGTGLEIGHCLLTAADCLLTGIATGPALVLDDEAELGPVVATFAAGNQPPFRPEPVPLPYVAPGPASLPASVFAGGLAPPAVIDLRLAGDELHREAQRVPGDDLESPVFIGAHAPDTAHRCDLRDPLPPPPAGGGPGAEPGPYVDYRARDARSLLALMNDRARLVLPGWEGAGPADQTTMILELVANRLDELSYKQESAVAEGFVGTARLRRSVEDHARLVDYVADPGLSATTMIRFQLGEDGIAELGLAGRFQAGGRLVIPADTLVVNPDAADRLVVFATEGPLPFDVDLDELRLADESSLEPGIRSAVEPGDTSALLEGDLARLEVGRWLVIAAVDPEKPEFTDPETPAHVVRVTRVERSGDSTRVVWDPRRPSPARYERETARIYGNVVPAHHGLPLTPVTAEGPGAVREREDLLRPWRERLTIHLRDGDAIREIPMPMGPVSVQANGWPLPARPPRSGRPQIALSVDGEPWRLVDDLSVQDPGEECFVLRAGIDGGAAVRVGDGVTGAPLPARDVAVDVAVRIGLGAFGNVRAGAITQLLALGEGGDAAAILGEGHDPVERFTLIRHRLRVTNPVPGIGGRDPEPLERIRYRAPLGVRDVLSAVVPEDYERLVEALPEVAASRARVVDAGVRPVVRVTLLLRDEDGLAAAGEQGEAERLRRWAVARERLESVRLLGYDVELVPPRFVALDIDLVVDAEAWVVGDALEHDVREGLAGQGGLFDPDVSGLGGDVHLDAIHRRVRAVSGVAAVRVNRLRRLAPRAVDHRGVGVLPIASDEVAILRHPYGDGFPQGLLTIEVCGAAP
jgi:hypothetical protein